MEAEIADYLRRNGFPWAVARPHPARFGRGSIEALPVEVIASSDTGREYAADDRATEAARIAGKLAGVAIRRRRGAPVADWRVSMTLGDLAALMRAVGPT